MGLVPPQLSVFPVTYSSSPLFGTIRRHLDDLLFNSCHTNSIGCGLRESSANHAYLRPHHLVGMTKYGPMLTLSLSLHLQYYSNWLAANYSGVVYVSSCRVCVLSIVHCCFFLWMKGLGKGHKSICFCYVIIHEICMEWILLLNSCHALISATPCIHIYQNGRVAGKQQRLPKALNTLNILTIFNFKISNIGKHTSQSI